MPTKSSEYAAIELEDRVSDLAAIARLITYARESCKQLDVMNSAYCLDQALSSLLEELAKCGVRDVNGVVLEKSAARLASSSSH